MAIKLLVSFVAGLTGFISPCVLPLLPGYVGYMTGGAAGERVPLRRALPGTAAFVGGLAVVFVSLGAAASAVGALLRAHQRQLELASGAFIVALGLLMLSGRGPAALLRERRFHPRPRLGAGWAFLLGAAFAFGWTPCIGPTLGAALNLAATEAGLARGVALLSAYAAGIGLPFLAAGLGLVGFGGRLKRHAPKVQAAGGAVLAVVGVLILTGRLTLITIWMRRALSRLGLDLWNI